MLHKSNFFLNTYILLINDFYLQDMYTSLIQAGFSHTQIEQALNNSVLHGGDLIDALDWLCLNIANGLYAFLIISEVPLFHIFDRKYYYFKYIMASN